jgi:hypothetical protein
MGYLRIDTAHSHYRTLKEKKMQHESWSPTEKKICQRAFEAARDREYDALLAEVREKVAAMSSPYDIWDLNDFLYKKRREIGEKYDYRYSMLIYVFARLLREGWLHMDELAGLSEDKLRRIKGAREL